MRALVTGMGGQLGTLVARRLERLDDVEAIVGVDLDPPRRRLHRAEFHWTRPGDTQTLAQVVKDFDPTVVLHLGQYEPHARLVPQRADAASRQATESLLAALEGARSLQTIVVRSGTEVYGRARGRSICPDETIAPEPTSQFGRRLFETEESVAAFARTRSAAPSTKSGQTNKGSRPTSVKVVALRFAPIVGDHAPSPLARILKLQAVPVPAIAEPTFSLVHAAEAADLVVAAARSDAEGPINVVAPGVVSAFQAARIGGHVPVPVLGPGWFVARRGVEFMGSPMPDHVHELLVRGRSADGGRCAAILGAAPTRSTRDIVTEIHEQTSVEYLDVVDGYAA